MRKTAVWTLLLTLLMGGAAFAGDETVAPAQLPEEITAPAPLANEVSPETPTLPEQPALSFLYASCSQVCTSFHAYSYGDCTDTNCYARGCGAPNYFDSGTCTCYCSYCF